MSATLAYSPSAVLFGLPLKSKVVFFRQLATMIHSGLPVGRGVVTASQAGCKELGKELAHLIENGSPLSDAMAKYPNHFNKYEIALVRAGEKSGQLDRQLEELAKSTEATWRLQQNVSSKMLYPMLIAHSVVILPPLFILVTDGIKAYLTTVLGILIPVYFLATLFMLGFRFSRQYPGPKRMLDRFLVSLPIFGKPTKYGARIRFMQTLGNLVSAGFLPGQAIPLAAESSNNLWLRDKVIIAWRNLGDSASMSEVVSKSGAFESFEIGLLVTGEETGSFVSSIQKAAEALIPEYEAQIHRISVVLPVIMLLVVGVYVGYTAVTTMTSIFAPVF